MIKKIAPIQLSNQKLTKDGWLLAALFLFALTIAYLLRGYYFLLFSEIGAGDLFARWQEQQYIYRGLYPYPLPNQPSNYLPAIGEIRSGGYPAWAFFSGFLVFPHISWASLRIYQAFLNALSLGVLTLFAYQLGQPHSKSKALFATASCLAISSHATTLGLGQYGIIINAFLISFYWLFKRHQIGAGLLLGLALGKPNISAFFLLPLLIKGKYKAVIAFFLYIALATLSIITLTRVNLVSVFKGLYEQLYYFGDHGYTAVTVFSSLGVRPEMATLLLGGMVCSIGMIFLRSLRHQPLLSLFAMSSVMGRVALYHRVYDNVMLVFLLAALMSLFFQSGKRNDLFIFILVGVTLWIPAKLTDFSIVQIAQTIIWISSLIYLLMRERKSKEVA
jgi:hypothetical protein